MWVRVRVRVRVRVKVGVKFGLEESQLVNVQGEAGHGGVGAQRGRSWRGRCTQR
jgi:hypothetical protein